MIDALCAGVVAAAGLFLLGLGVAAIALPASARRFLLGFAGSPRLHALELALRSVVGIALWQRAPAMQFAAAFTFFAGVLLLTTLLLALVPWRWHRQFTETAVPQALRWLPLLGLASILFGGTVLYALLAGPASTP
jgi:hypothetical protein